jgi:hypothetical protein
VEFLQSNSKHIELLQTLPKRLYGEVSTTKEKWEHMGFQSGNPSTDFRGGGLMSLECIIYFVEQYGK